MKVKEQTTAKKEQKEKVTSAKGAPLSDDDFADFIDDSIDDFIDYSALYGILLLPLLRHLLRHLLSYS